MVGVTNSIRSTGSGPTAGRRVLRRPRLSDHYFDIIVQGIARIGCPEPIGVRPGKSLGRHVCSDKSPRGPAEAAVHHTNPGRDRPVTFLEGQRAVFRSLYDRDLRRLCVAITANGIVGP